MRKEEPMSTVLKPGVPRVLAAAKRSVLRKRKTGSEPGPWDQGHWANRK